MDRVREPFANPLGLKGMQKLVPAAALFLVLLTAACGSGEPGAVGGSTGAGDDAPPPTVPAPDPEQLYEVDGIVLEDSSHGPELCLGGVALSLPPQCGGVPLANWDWDAVDGAQSGSGTTWGDFHVVGTYADGVLTVTEVGPAEPDGLRAASGTVRSFTTSCPEPAGGWPMAVWGVAQEEAFAAGSAVAQARADHVALWVDYAGDLTPEEVDQAMVEGKPVAKIMNVVVTGDIAETEAAIRTVWRGPLCVVQHEGRTQRELQAIRAEAERYIQEELGLEMTWSSEGDIGLAAEVGVVIDVGGAGQAALDERYGPGMVKLFPALRPVGE
jgi:hypothetical protein